MQAYQDMGSPVAVWIADTRESLAFLSRLMKSKSGILEERKLHQVMAGFGPAGLIIGAAGGLGGWICISLGLPEMMAAIIAVAVLMVITGGMHEDGLGDATDGLGGWTRQAALDIMRDSPVGVYGVLALVMVSLFRVTGYSTLMSMHGGLFSVVLIFAATGCLSRAGLPYLMYILPAARTDGLAVSAGQPDRHTAIRAAVAGIFLYALTVWLAIGLFAAIIGAVLACAAIVLTSKLARHTYGGVTGDVAGSAQQLAEVAILAGLVIAG